MLAFALQKNICLGLSPGDAIVLCLLCVSVALALSKMPQSLCFNAPTFLIFTASPLLLPPYSFPNYLFFTIISLFSI